MSIVNLAVALVELGSQAAACTDNNQLNDILNQLDAIIIEATEQCTSVHEQKCCAVLRDRLMQDLMNVAKSGETYDLDFFA